MNLTAHLEELQQQHAADPRTSLWDISMDDNCLQGVADKQHRAALSAFAATGGLECSVCFLEASRAFVTAGHSFLYSRPDMTEVVSELIYGQQVNCYDSRGPAIRVAGQHDHYLGWLKTEHLGQTLPAPNAILAVPRAHLFSEAKVSASRLAELGLNSRLSVYGESGDWLEVAYKNQSGYLRKRLVHPDTLASPAAEHITSLATRFLETPYVWGGTTAWGLDCSGLVQTVFAACGIALPRDADQQERCGKAVEADSIQAADLLFFPGHVAITLDREQFIHANAHHMRVTVDSVHSDYGQQLMRGLTSVRRVLCGEKQVTRSK